MACFHPWTAWKTKDGITTQIGSGKEIDPFPLRMKCGKCMGCRMERTSSWAVRCVHEAMMNTYPDTADVPWKFRGTPRNSFVTLTYNDAHVPKDGTLQLRDWQLFMKRLRKRRPQKIRFLHSGEYGERKQRPHYHGLLFNEDFGDDRTVWQRTKRGDPLYRSDTLDSLWKCQRCGESLGFCTIGAVSFQSAAYTARYALKNIDSNSDEWMSRYPLRLNKDTGEIAPVPPYSTMSRRDGIGKSFFEKYADDIYKDDQVILDGKSYRPPRYYDRLYKEQRPLEFENVMDKRIEHAKKRDGADPRELEEMLRVAEEIALAKQRRSEEEKLWAPSGLS